MTGFDSRSGEPAESKFKEYAKAKGMDVERYGFDRTPLRNFHRLPHFVRATPDFVATRNHQAFLVECKAGGQGDTVNIKHTDIPILQAWSNVGLMYLFVNDSAQQRVCFIVVQDFMSRLESSIDELRSDQWDNGTPYVKIPKHLLPWEKYDEF